MTEAITRFSGEYEYLSNFSRYGVPWRVCGPGAEKLSFFLTAEHAFQASKTLNWDEQQQIFKAESPGEAKQLGAIVTLREGWDEIKLDVMFGVLVSKFLTHSELRERLVATGSAGLIEGNTWGDTYWGAIPTAQSWQGENHLGRLLMRVREIMQ